MEKIVNRNVGDLVAENIKSAHIFKKYGIDFCCGGGITLEKACIKNNVSIDQITNDLNSLNQPVAPEKDFNSFPLDKLIDYILNVHHSYIRESIPLVLQYGTKVSSVHGDRHPELREIFQLFHDLVNELIMHMKKEEMILFPHVKKLLHGIRAQEISSIQSPIAVMESEHENAGNILKTIGKLSSDFTPPSDACNTYRAFYAKLQEFQDDLHKHIHLENNILFPKAIKLESDLIAD